MPPRGRIGGTFPPEATPAQRTLAEALQRLCSCLPDTLKVISAQLNISEPALSHYLHARRIPDETVVRSLYAAAAAKQDPAQLPHSEDELLGLRRQAKGCPRGGCAKAQPEPADLGDRRNGAAAYDDAGDRRNAPQTGPPTAGAGQQVGILAGIEDTGPENLIGLLWAAGGELSEGEAASALCALADAAQADEADILLASLASHGRDLAEVIRGVLAAR